MKNLELNIKHVAEFVTKSQIDAFNSAAANGLEQLEKAQVPATISSDGCISPVQHRNRL